MEFFRNPTPANKSENLKGVKWQTSGRNGSHLLIGENLVFRRERPVNFEIELFEKIADILAPIESDCIKTPLLNTLKDSPLNPLNSLLKFVPVLIGADF